MSTPKYVDIHALHALPYSNVNRDDLNNPKTVVFGGAERTRVSSQSWKRMIRRHLEKHLGEETVRTRRVVVGVAERLTAQGWAKEEAEAAGIQVAVSAGKGISLKPAKNDKDEVVLTTNVLLLLPEIGIDDLAALAVEHRDVILAEATRVKKQTDVKPKLPSEKVDAILSRSSGTINLFGRMLTEVPGANVDGAVQVAHAFTTHATQVEYDFFTAVDDVEHNLNLTGSGHMNTGLFSAGTFYRYANINLADLLHNLGGDTALARTLVTECLNGFIRTLPSGKQNATAPATVPDLVHVVVRDDQPVSLASAFEAPVGGEQGHLAQSVSRLHTHARAITDLLGPDHVQHAGHTVTPTAVNDRSAATGLEAFGTNSTSFSSLIHDAVAVALPGGAA